MTDDFDDGTIGTGPRCRAFMCEVPTGVIPVQMRNCAGTFFVGIGGAIVGEQGEGGVGSRIDAEFGDGLHLMRAFDF